MILPLDDPMIEQHSKEYIEISKELFHSMLIAQDTFFRDSIGFTLLIGSHHKIENCWSFIREKIISRHILLPKLIS